MCGTHYAAWRRAANPEAAAKHREHSKASYHRHREKVSERRKIAYNPDKAREYNREYYTANREKVIAQAQKWDAEHPGRAVQRSREHYLKAGKDNHLRRKFGLSLEQAEALLVSQGGVCALCGQPIGGWGRRGGGVVDHCHTTGRVRGILHSLCNTGLGAFRDSSELLRRAIGYLEKSPHS
jgi:hypothetical protein